MLMSKVIAVRFQRAVFCMGNSMEADTIFSLEQSPEVADVERRLGISRRDFLKFCAAMAATMGLPAGAEAAIAAKPDPPRNR